MTPEDDGTTSTSFTPLSVYGTYQPLVGDFDGNAIDDVLWYAPGRAGDSLWLFRADGTHRNMAVTINGTYRPAVIEANGDGYDDIVWYGPGSVSDSMWLFGPGGTHVGRSLSIGGSDYVLVPGHFGDRPEGSPQQRLLFYSPSGYDSIWTFDTLTGHTSAATPSLGSGYEPVTGRFHDPHRNSVLWYRPGGASEALWSFTPTGAVTTLPAPPVYGTYDPAVGDFDGNGYDDIAWAREGRATIWHFTAGSYSSLSFDTALPNTVALTSLHKPF